MNHTSHRTLEDVVNPKKPWFERHKADIVQILGILGFIFAVYFIYGRGVH